jgi:hypothetical protein
MPLTDADDLFLSELWRKLGDTPLPAGSPLYEPLHAGLDAADPVWLMQRQVRLSGVESLQLFSGFRGGGKTTELLRLKAVLEEKGYLVLYADALDYINPAEPVDVSGLIMVLAGAFSDRLAAESGIDLQTETFWTRFANFLTRTKVTITGVELKGELGGIGAAGANAPKVGLGIKAEFKTGSTFRDRLQTALSGLLAELKAEADDFFEAGVKAVQRKYGEEKQIVFIFDQLEQIRGNYENWASVIRSVEQLFTVHLDKMRQPYVHAIYSVPPWLKFITPPDAPMTILPTVHLWNNDAERSPFARGWEIYRSLIERRMHKTEIERLFGESGTEAIDRLIGACGGHVRDLLRLLQQTVRRADSLPVSKRVVDNVISAARSDLLPVALEDAKWLLDISQRRDTALRAVSERAIERLSNFLDSHRVIYFVNGSEWYDIHPLIREEVARVVAAGDGHQAS